MAPFEPKRAKILVVEDTVMMRVLMERHLKQAGFPNVQLVENGKAALELLAAEPIDLVLLDIQMPVMDGYETLKRIRANSALGDPAVIIVTVVDKIESVAQCIADGAEDYMPKLFNPILLTAKITTCLELRYLRKRVRELEAQ